MKLRGSFGDGPSFVALDLAAELTGFVLLARAVASCFDDGNSLATRLKEESLT